MKIVEFNGDPMVQLEKFDDLDKEIFYLNQESFDEIMSYSYEVNDNIPEFFNGKENDYLLLAEGGIDEEGKEFPDTYIGINTTNNEEGPYMLSAIYASDFEYSAPLTGERVLLKKNNQITK